MKRDIVEFVAKCFVCQLAEVENQRLAGELQPLPILEWKWEDISMDFVIRLPRTSTRKNSIWVIVDILTKSAHFLPITNIDSMDKLSKIYVKDIVRLHGVPRSIVSDRDTQFISLF